MIVAVLTMLCVSWLISLDSSVQVTFDPHMRILHTQRHQGTLVAFVLFLVGWMNVFLASVNKPKEVRQYVVREPIKPGLGIYAVLRPQFHVTMLSTSAMKMMHSVATPVGRMILPCTLMVVGVVS